MRRLLVVPLVALAVVGVEYAIYYHGTYSPPALTRPAVEEILLKSYAGAQEPLEVPPQRVGVALVDTGHVNRYNPAEADVLLSRIVARGYRIEFLRGRTPEDRTVEDFSPDVEALEAKLRFASSLVVLVPGASYTPEEVALVKRFVRKGGRVLIVGDPTRTSEVNTLANGFGITFRDDYLYNVKQHEGNFQNVFFTRFTADPLTLGLQRVTFYVASSIAGTGEALVTADEDTLSSVLETNETLSPMVKDVTGRVLAISDFTFMSEPYRSVTDNDRLIANIADFLTTGRREFDLTDFPHIFNEGVDIVVTSPALLPQATLFKGLLLPTEGEVAFREREDFQRNTVVIGLFQDIDRVRHYLARANIVLDDGKETRITTPFAPPILKEGSGLLYLDTQAGRRVLVVLAESPAAVDRLVKLLGTGEFRSGLVSDAVGLYPGPPSETE